MSGDLAAIDRLDISLHAPVGQLAARLREIWSDGLLALVIYGPALEEVQHPSRRLLYSAIVLERVELDRLRQLAAEGTRLGELGLARPLVFTPGFLRDSCDTFPLEFIEIQQRHLTVLGTDYFKPLVFRDVDVRLQCERELKVLLIGMHQAMLAAKGDERALAGLTDPLVEHLLRTLRGVLWLKGQRDALPPGEVVGAVEQRLGRALAGIRGVVTGRGGAPWDAFRQLYADVQALEQYVDAA